LKEIHRKAISGLVTRTALTNKKKTTVFIIDPGVSSGLLAAKRKKEGERKR
jgi:hypothetical protein